MISEGSCNTEDWSNDAENSALPSHYSKHIPKLIPKTFKNLTDPKPLNRNEYYLWHIWKSRIYSR